MVAQSLQLLLAFFREGRGSIETIEGHASLVKTPLDLGGLIWHPDDGLFSQMYHGLGEVVV
jgi:hypothetical protein